MSFDFSNEEAQSDYKVGPVPSGSIVFVRLTLLEPTGDQPPDENPLVKVGKSGLRMLYAQLEVIEGEYRGCSWRQHIALPCGMQPQGLSENLETASRIGGSLLKAILLACHKPLNVSNLRVFDNLIFPVKVRINKKSYKPSTGGEFWRNEIARVITPEDDEYSEIMRCKEIINPHGAITGPISKDSQPKQLKKAAVDHYEPNLDRNYETDDVPF